jgi:hypothetical protein
VVFGRDANGDHVKAGQSTYRITEALLDAVTQRYIFLLKEGGINRMGYPYHLAAGQYNDSSWEGCPNSRACPFIAAALKPSITE